MPKSKTTTVHTTASQSTGAQSAGAQSAGAQCAPAYRRKAKRKRFAVKRKRPNAKSSCFAAKTKRCNERNKRSTVGFKRRIAFIGGALIIALIAVILLMRPVGRKVYPIHYAEEVFHYATEYELDPCLVFAVIKVESDFTPNAVSRAGAQGLMQIMPDTADWIAWRQGREHDGRRILEPEYNIDMGCYLLSYLMEYYGGNIDYALAAYNAGKGAVDGWLESSEYFDGSKLRIPYEETDNYVKKVNFAYKSYKELYHEEFCDK